MKVVIDTNLFISALINKNSRTQLSYVLENPIIEIFASKSLFTELIEVSRGEKFSKYVSKNQIETYLGIIFERLTFVEVISDVKFSPDPKDNFLLSLCKDCEANFLLTGNKIDLLDLIAFEKTEIVTLSVFNSKYNTLYTIHNF